MELEEVQRQNLKDWHRQLFRAAGFQHHRLFLFMAVVYISGAPCGFSHRMCLLGFPMRQGNSPGPWHSSAHFSSMHSHMRWWCSILTHMHTLSSIIQIPLQRHHPCPALSQAGSKLL